MKDIIVISGPTATGKTSTSIKLAKLFNAEVVNFDSLVFYKELTIGTAKPTTEEMDGVPHHLVGTQSIEAPLNAADFQKKAIAIINKIHNKNRSVVLVGGSGFYLQTILNGMYKGGSTPKEITEKSNLLYTEEGIQPFITILKQSDIKSYNQYHENDHYRIRRAVEFFWSTGQPFSSQREKMKEYTLESPVKLNNWKIKHIHLDIDKESHYEIIKKRSNQMINDGLINEVKVLLDQGFSKKLKPLNSIGYKETLAYLNNEFDNIDSYIERINISTRQLAKSQRTWFKKLNLTTFNPLDQFDSIVEYIKRTKENI